MEYEDFKLNPNEFEKMVKEFDGQNNVKKMDLDAEEVELSQRQISFIDILIGFKILERLFICCKDKSNNSRILNFVDKHFNTVETISYRISSLGDNIGSSDIDFEYPEDDREIIKMIYNLVTSEIANLAKIHTLLDKEDDRNITISTIEDLANLAKEAISLN